MQKVFSFAFLLGLRGSTVYMHGCIVDIYGLHELYLILTSISQSSPITEAEGIK
jgi:hypothetical protein